MKKHSLVISILFLSLSFASRPVQAQAPTPGFHNESEAGLVLISGNTTSQSYNFKQSNQYVWDQNVTLFSGRFLDTNAQGTETARYWSLSLRYERELSERVGIFVSEMLESNVFAGFLQRYNTDAGAKYSLIKDEATQWSVEGGYRYSAENRFVGQQNSSLIRLYTEFAKKLSADLAAKIWLEVLPNLTVTADYQLNSEASLIMTLSQVLSFKTGYLLKYRALPPAGIGQTTDTWFTTSLIAKF